MYMSTSPILDEFHSFEHNGEKNRTMSYIDTSTISQAFIQKVHYVPKGYHGASAARYLNEKCKETSSELNISTTYDIGAHRSVDIPAA